MQCAFYKMDVKACTLMFGIVVQNSVFELYKRNMKNYEKTFKPVFLSWQNYSGKNLQNECSLIRSI